jgi:uncharacterized protein YcbX
MTPRLARICRHPIKGHGREDLASVVLSEGECLPWDRHWAVAHEAAALVPGWNACVNFARGAKAPALMAVTSRLDEATQTVTLLHPDRPEFRFRPGDPDDLPGFLSWIAPLAPPDRAAPARIVSADRGMTDSDFPSVSILSLASLADLSARMGHDLSPDRWRGNLWIDGLQPWAEWDLVGRSLRIGAAELQVRERITRCRATSADPMTGRIDVDTLAGLRAAYGHEDFGLYAVVTRGGAIRPGDPVEVAA